MDLFGNKVDIKIETVILFLLIGIVIVLLLFCFEPWKAISPARDPTPQQVIPQVEQTVQPVSNDSKVNIVEPFQQVTADSRILYKKVGFTTLGDKDAKVNILRFKTRTIKDSEKDFQVAYMFTQDMETLKSLNKGEPVTLLDTTTTQPPATITPPDIVLKNRLYEIYGLPADYVTYSMDLIDKVVANYTTNKGDDKAKLTAVQNLIKDEFSKLPADGQEWQKRLKNGLDKIATEIANVPKLKDYYMEYLMHSIDVNAYLNSGNNFLKLTTINLIESLIYANQTTPFTLKPVSGIGSLLNYMYSYDTIKPIIDSTIINDLYSKITTYSTATPQTRPIISSAELAASKTKFTTDVSGKFANDTDILSNANINTISDNIYKIFDAFLESKFSEDITTTTQPAAAPAAETDPQIIQVLQAIGSKYYDPATGERKSRDNDFYLEFSNGLEVNIKFLFNYVTNMTGEVKCEATIIELPPGSAADPAYKTYKFDTCQLEYINGRMIITFTKTTSPVNYAKVAGGKYDNVTVTQTFKLEINLGDTQVTESDTFQSIINRAVFFNTFMTYSLAARLEDSAGSVKPIYTINLFPQSITSAFESLREYTKSALNKTTERLLKDNVAEIVTPMFMVDQRLDRTEGILAKIKDHYRFNELSSAQSGYRFYPVSE